MPSRVFLASSGIAPWNGAPGVWDINLRSPLRDLGLEIVDSAIDWDAAMFARDTEMRDRLRAENSQKLVEEVRRAHRVRPLDLFFSYFYSWHVHPEAIRQIAALGVPTLNFYCNAAHQFHLVEEIAASFDFCWVPERQALASYKRAGANPLHVQMGANERICLPKDGVEREHAVTFCGTLYADRAETLRGISEAGVPLTVFSGRGAKAVSEPGPSGPNGARRSRAREALTDLVTRGPAYLARRTSRYYRNRQALAALAPILRPSAPDLIDLFNRSQVVLNLSNVFDRGEPGGAIKAHVRLREFEVPLCRALFAPQWCGELEEYYDLEKEVVAWRTPAEAAEKLKFLLAHPGEAERIREAGYLRARNCHTARHRLIELFEKARLRLLP